MMLATIICLWVFHKPVTVQMAMQSNFRHDTVSLLFISFCSLSYIQFDDNALIYFVWIFFLDAVVVESFVFHFRHKANLQRICSLTIRHLGSSAKSLLCKLFPARLETQKRTAWSWGERQEGSLHQTRLNLLGFDWYGLCQFWWVCLFACF